MPKGEKQQHRGAVGKFDAGGELGPIEDRNEFERRLDALPPDQKELAQENTRFADLCATFLTKRWTSLLKFLIRSEALRDFRLWTAFAF